MQHFGGDVPVAVTEQKPRQIQALPRGAQARFAQLHFDVTGFLPIRHAEVINKKSHPTPLFRKMLPREPDFPAFICRKARNLTCYFHYSEQNFKDTGHIVAGILMRRAAAILARRIRATDSGADGADEFSVR